MVDIYPYERRLKRIEERIRNSKEIREEDKVIIFKFRDECFAQGNGLARIIRHFYCLRDIAMWLNKSLVESKTEDIKELVAKIERMDKYKPRTKLEYKATLKRFYKFLRKEENPEEVRWIKMTLKRHQEKLPSDLLNENNIISMIDHTQNIRDRAIIISLYESGCRIGEFLKIQIRDILFDRYGCFIDVSGKTGGRRIRLIISSSYLIEWVNQHPDKENPDAFLWLKHNSTEMMSYPALCKVLRVAKKRSGIKKKINPHNFRHSRATYLAGKLTEQQLKVYLGWTRASKMAAVYVHLSSKDVNDSILNLYGIKKEESETEMSNLIPKKCVRCSFENEPTNKFCKRCGLPINEKIQNEIIQKESERNDMDNLMSKLIKDPDVMKVLMKKMKEIKNE